ncbi:MAG TPA: M1 family metallopeptidase [Bacteroidota bacterium]|jgi:hypothetical protein|nr:M1 family metallopeptidase [Bacteroidota bacterium]
MRALPLLCTILFAGMCIAQPVLFPTPLSPRIANYNIDVRLDVQTRTLKGRETLLWFNKSADTIRELQFHLYLNAFRNTKSTFMKESGVSVRGTKIDEDGWGFINVGNITTASGENVTQQLQYIHPDDDNENDKTVGRLPLSQGLAPGDSILLNIDFLDRMPQPPFARTGAKEEYYFIGQWFPKVGVYIDGKWNCHQFHATTEFFADFGVYNVHMTVPEKNILGATGIQVEVRNNGDGTATHFYHAEDVHDFAWTTSPEFVEFTGEAEGVKIRALMQPDHIDQGARHIEAAKTAITYFHKWYGTYPFPNLTVVDPRRGAAGSGGMEYPTLITAGTSYGMPEGLRFVELVVIHEFGHNYWYHLLASNEFEETWMDEGINTYTEYQIMNDRYGPTGDGIDLFGLKINDQQLFRSQYLLLPDVDPAVRNAWQYYSGGSYGTNSYVKPGLLLSTLHNYLGKETMLKIMRTYVERWSFKHPKSKDFIAVANEVSGQNLDWFFDQALYTNAVLDYAVDQVSTRPVPKNRGFDITRSVDSLAAGSNEGKESEGISSSDSTTMYLSEVKIRRLGAFKFPVELEVRFENGETTREKWDGLELWKKFTYTRSSRLVYATVDPDHKVALDVNFTNNSKTIATHELGIDKVAVRFLFWVQSMLDLPEWLNITALFDGLF